MKKLKISDGIMVVFLVLALFLIDWAILETIIKWESERRQEEKTLQETCSIYFS